MRPAGPGPWGRGPGGTPVENSPCDFLSLPAWGALWVPQGRSSLALAGDPPEYSHLRPGPVTCRSLKGEPGLRWPAPSPGSAELVLGLAHPCTWGRHSPFLLSGSCQGCKQHPLARVLSCFLDVLRIQVDVTSSFSALARGLAEMRLFQKGLHWYWILFFFN